MLTPAPNGMVQAQERVNRKAEVLLEILSAGEAVEARIRAYRDEVDELMLQLLLKRIEAAQRCALSPHIVPRNCASSDFGTVTMQNLLISSPSAQP